MQKRHVHAINVGCMEHQYPRISCQKLKAFPGELKVFTTIVCISQKIFIPLYWNNEITIIIWWSAGETNEHSHNMIFLHRASFLLRSNIPQPVHPHFGIRAAGKTLTSCPSTPYRRLRNPRYTHYLNCHIQKQAPTPPRHPHLRTPNIQCEEKPVTFRDTPCEETIR